MNRAVCASMVFALAALSCDAETLPLTQVMVVVDSDLPQLDGVRVTVDGMGAPKRALADDLDEHPLPRTVAVVHEGGPLGPITVTADALANESTLVSRRAEVSFIEGRNVMLTLFLEQSCVGKSCDDDQTCAAGQCRDMAVDPKKLPEWSGVPKHVEAGSGGKAGQSGSGGRSGSGGNTAGMSGKGGQSGQSSGTGGTGGAGSGAGTGGSMSDPCASCKFASSTAQPHAQVACDAGKCMLTCDSGYADADNTLGNGCEMSTTGFSWTAQNIDPALASLLSARVQSLTFDCSATLDLGSGALPSTVDICGDTVTPVLVTQKNGGPEVVAFAARHLSVTASSKFRFTGSRPVAIVVYGDAEIDGELDVSAIGVMGGAGSNTECSPGAGAMGTSSAVSGGGGGGGFGTNGGDGATRVLPMGAQPGAGGVVSSSTSVSPLRGGCSGGAGGKGLGKMAPGGAGGGALQLSVSGTLRVSGTLAAAGGGGVPGDDAGDGGGGGGSGGAILLEAGHLQTVSGAWLTANGGGGGEGHPGVSFREPGSDGAHASATPAPGGPGRGVGGNGGAGTTAAMTAPAPDCVTSQCGGGGGGGGVGRIVLRSPDCQISGNASPLATCSAP